MPPPPRYLWCYSKQGGGSHLSSSAPPGKVRGMLRKVTSKVAWVGRTASMVFGLALVLALISGWLQRPSGPMAATSSWGRQM
jgi:hypothetical protein